MKPTVYREERNDHTTRAHLRHFHIAGITLLAFLFLASGCSPEASPAKSSPHPRTPLLTPTQSSLVVAPGDVPTLTPPALGAVPHNCPAGSSLKAVFPDIIPVVGTAPVWAAGFVGPHATLHIGNGKSGSQATAELTYTIYGWERKLLWRLSNKAPGPVTLYGGALQDDTPLWFQIDSQAPSTAPVLIPVTSEAALQTDFTSFPSYLYIPKAGCYYLEANWPGGSWRIFFASGL